MKGRVTQEEIDRANGHRCLAFVEDGGSPYNTSVRVAVTTALNRYRKRFPGCRAREAWFFYDGDPTTKKIAVNRDGTPRTGRVDVYCLFCRVMLVPDARLDGDYGPMTIKHTTVCALKCLAGDMEPGAPGTYRLPESV